MDRRKKGGGEKMTEKTISFEESKRLIQSEVEFRSPILARWLRLLWGFFALSGAAVVYLAFANLPVKFDAVKISMIVVGGLSVPQGAVLLRLSAAEKKYLAAGIFQILASIAIGIIYIAMYTTWLDVLPYVGWVPCVVLVLSLYMVGAYYRCSAHSSALFGAASELAPKWKKLWIWKLVCAAMVPVIFAFSVPLGARTSDFFLLILDFLFIADLICLLFLWVLELFYLYCTITVFAARIR